MSKRKPRPRSGEDGDFDPKDLRRQSRKQKRKRGKGDRAVFYVPPELGDGFDSEPDDEPEDFADYDEDLQDYWDDDDGGNYRR